MIRHRTDLSGFDVIEDNVLREDNIMFNNMDCDIINTFVKVARFHAVAIDCGKILDKPPYPLLSKSGKRSKSSLQKSGLTQACNSPILQRFKNGTLQ